MLHFGQNDSCFGVLAWCDRRLRVRELECRRLGTAMTASRIYRRTGRHSYHVRKPMTCRETTDVRPRATTCQGDVEAHITWQNRAATLVFRLAETLGREILIPRQAYDERC